VRWWKWIGLAGLVGAAAGAVVVTQRRRRTWREYDPDELRSRLHARLAEARAGDPAVSDTSQVVASAAEPGTV
jgi:hypothetical protein